jgi:putative Mg2+ transporter-C (MgtC) family protein
MVLSPADVVIRLVLITVLAGLIGIEREYHKKPAGLRTNIMVGLGATLMTIASIRVLDLFPGAVGADPMRIAAQIITGIGFIGAGAILRREDGVIGVTTAATLWVVTGLGIAIGLGLYLEAFVTTAIAFFTFLILGRWVPNIRKAGEDAQ